MARIFDRQVPRPAQLAAVAERRFGDANALCATNDNQRANGAQYLCGFVIEILLKRKLLLVFEQTAKLRHDVPEAEEKIWKLIWRSHDLREMLNKLPTLEAAVKKAGERGGKPLDQWLKQVCATWTIYARYSSMSATMTEAREMLARVRELKEVLK